MHVCLYVSKPPTLLLSNRVTRNLRYKLSLYQKKQNWNSLHYFHNTLLGLSYLGVDNVVVNIVVWDKARTRETGGFVFDIL